MPNNFEFVNPEYFWLFLLLPVLILWFFWKRKQQNAALKISSIQGFKSGSNWLAKLKPLLFVLRLLALSALIIAMARPRTVDESTRTKTTRGIDIVISIDVSASMLARDLKPNRLEALKTVAARFINERPNDRIGLVEYAGESYTRTPLTSDKSIVLSSLKNIQYNTVIEGGTAIGSGLATAVNRLKESGAKSKVIILLTDGVNNTGFIDPKIASELAVEFGIKVYTIGLGSNGLAMSPIGIRPDGSFQYGNVQVEIDEALLQEIAKTTGGQYFRATSNTKLQQIYDEINKLEKTDIEEFRYTNYDEMFRPWAIFALVLIGFETLLRFTLFKGFI
ncbi:vWA domain-containing protein [Aequorivita echinoideorum]|uniref:VWA domain-containing protein n=1 Tax=Aequorivita echinoideorum TaxID=1549647 RepID=A0ABS5S3R6_9FLAO|nr:VWA domain-containing protein [Aequorivita echinoideorum]MBT0607080.1 VWA domain-containing protein [Aequorivita echinoideorum]